MTEYNVNYVLSLLVLGCFLACRILQQLSVALVGWQLNVSHNWATYKAVLNWQLQAVQSPHNNSEHIAAAHRHKTTDWRVWHQLVMIERYSGASCGKNNSLKRLRFWVKPIYSSILWIKIALSTVHKGYHSQGHWSCKIVTMKQMPVKHSLLCGMSRHHLTYPTLM